MPTASYRVLSPHYEGSPAIKKLGSAMDIPPEKIINGRTFVAPTVSQFADKWSPLLIGNDVVTVTSSGRRYKTHHSTYVHHGPNTGQIDDSGMTGFKYASERVYPSRPENTQIPEKPHTLYLKGTRLRMYFPDKNDTPVNLSISNRLAESVPLRQVGVYESKAGEEEITFRSILKGGEFHDEARAYMDFLAEKGIAHNSGPILGYGVRKSNAIASYFPADDFVTRDYHMRTKVARWISSKGVSGKDAVDAMERSAFYHEFAHKFIGGEARDESLQGRLHHEFYARMAKSHTGRKKQVYEAVAEAWKDYEKAYSRSWLDNILDKFGPGRNQPEVPSELVIRVGAEADAKGLIGAERRDYISERINEELGPARKYYAISRKGAKYTSHGKQIGQKREANLDEKVEELAAEADSRGIDRTEYISSYLARNPPSKDYNKIHPKTRNRERRSKSEKPRNSKNSAKSSRKQESSKSK